MLLKGAAVGRKLQYHINVSSYQIFNCDTLPIKILTGFFVEVDTRILIHIRENKRPAIAKITLKSKMGDSLYQVLRLTLK